MVTATRARKSTGEGCASCPPSSSCSFCERLQAENEELRERIRALEEENRDLRAKIAGLNQAHFGRQTEKGPPPSRPGSPREAKGSAGGRKRGQQRGSPGPKRRSHEHLPKVEEEHDLPEGEKCCDDCGKPFGEFPGTDDSEVIEIEVKAHVRRIHRKRYKRACTCPGKKIITAPPAPRVIPKSPIGISIWTTILLDKFLFYRPTYRLLRDLETHGLFLSQGTITGGLEKLLDLFEPLYAALQAKCVEADHWHADETRWQVFVKIEGKEGTRWYLWVFKSKDVVYFVLDPTRSAEVPKRFFGEEAKGIVSADRYVAYKTLIELGRLIIAYCWAHMRRDVLRLGQRHPEHAVWSEEWLERIGKLYGLNEARLLLIHDEEAFRAADEELRLFLLEMVEIRDAELARATRKEKRKVLESMKNHWEGLTLFFGFPEVPLDNSSAERSIRGPAVGRKNYYGSGSIWSGRLAAVMFSLLQTLELHGICPRKWMTRYLTACAEHGGRVPDDWESFLPWNLAEEDRQALSREVPISGAAEKPADAP